MASVLDMTAAERYSPSALLAAISNAHRLYFRDAERPELFNMILDDLLSLTECEYGFVGEVLYDASGSPYLKSWALTNIAWDEATNALYQSSLGPDGGLVFTNLDTLFGRVLVEATPLISNAPDVDPRRGGLPPGHPPMKCFLGIPLFRNDEMIGMVGVANRPGGFDETDVQYLEPFLATCAHLIDVIRSDRERAAAQAAERAAIEAVQRQERLGYIGRLASGVAHDVNNLITIISIQCDLIESEVTSHSGQLGIGRIREVCDSASLLANRLHQLRGRPLDAVANCDVRSTLKSSERVLAAIAGADLRVTIELDVPDDCRATIDEGDLLQVLLNLVSNAHDAGASNVTISVSTASAAADPEAGAEVVIVVSDDGPGVRPELRGSLFEPFVTSKGAGHGLGLPTVATLVESCGGRIELVDSDHGASFRISLPAS